MLKWYIALSNLLIVLILLIPVPMSILCGFNCSCNPLTSMLVSTNQERRPYQPLIIGPVGLDWVGAIIKASITLFLRPIRLS